MRNGGELRGNSRNRQVRKLRMLSDPRFGGTGDSCRCVHCSKSLTYEDLEADRIEPSGPYAYVNVQASCRPCNIQRSDNVNWVGPKPYRSGVLAA